MSARQMPGKYRFGFVMEQTLGHVTHYRNLRAAVECVPDVDAQWYPLVFPPWGTMETLPPLRGNWSARAATRTRRLLQGAGDRHDALFFHTQVTTLLCARLMRRLPSVISLDATPRNYDSIGAAYGHQAAGKTAEFVKQTLHTRPLRAARALVTWCDWARRSLVEEYGIDAERIHVIPPGVDLRLWPAPAPSMERGVVHILFVGGDFTRKGGELLLQAFSGLSERCELHLVTMAPVAARPGIHVYRDVAPNSEILRRLYATADLFVLPTLADCFPLVIQEAMAAGLPVIASDVGAIGEAVNHETTGMLVAPGDVAALRAALAALIDNVQRRRAMGSAGRLVAEQRFDSATNARRILDLLTGISRS